MNLSDNPWNIQSGDLVIYRSMKPSFFQAGIMFTCKSITHHVEVVGEHDGELVVGNAVIPKFRLDRFSERVRDWEAGKLKMLVCRWTPHTEPVVSHSSNYWQFQDRCNAVLRVFGIVPPKYDLTSIRIIMVNILRGHIRKIMPWFEDSIRNNEHTVYCSELAQVVHRACGDIDILEGLPPQTHSAPVHIERQLRRGKFTVIHDFGNLGDMIFTVLSKNAPLIQLQ